jgi:hypothetical protein
MEGHPGNIWTTGVAAINPSYGQWRSSDTTCGSITQLRSKNHKKSTLYCVKLWLDDMISYFHLHFRESYFSVCKFNEI